MRISGGSRGHGACAVARRWAVLAILAPGLIAAQEPDAGLRAMRAQVEAATRRSPPWSGPFHGPPGLRGKTIAILAEDLRNGGILGVAQGLGEAAGVLGWKVDVFDATGTPAGREKAAAAALAARPDGLALVGADAVVAEPLLLPFAARGVPIVGWHVASSAGKMARGPVLVNVTTDPVEVARVTAMAAVVQSRGQAGVVVFTDSRFAIAMAKASAMAEVIRACRECKLLEVRDVSISRSAEEMPGVTRELLARHGKRWTHALAINDIYFDHAVAELTRTGAPADRLRLLSAGDGSRAAFLRIQAGVFQVGTVAEPLRLQGWRLADELNRALAGQAPSAQVDAVHLVTSENIDHDGGPELRYDPDNGYREVFRRIWEH